MCRRHVHCVGLLCAHAVRQVLLDDLGNQFGGLLRNPFCSCFFSRVLTVLYVALCVREPLARVLEANGRIPAELQPSRRALAALPGTVEVLPDLFGARLGSYPDGQSRSAELDDFIPLRLVLQSLDAPV